MKKILTILSLLLFTTYTCISISPIGYIISDPGMSSKMRKEIVELYRPWQEISFCASSTEIYNIAEGYMFSVDLPICDPEDICFHSHPFIGDSFPSSTDIESWNKYWEKFGMKRFGLLLPGGEIKVYER